tara:strand:+ start:91 stop:441 length:351 start_codon:yes stop_codon:yes gene_type:complete
MAITTTWGVNDMTHKDSDGGVSVVYWSLITTDGKYSAQGGDKLRCTPNPSASDFIPYADLKESDVLGWVYSSLIEKKEDGSKETAAEAKARVEAKNTAKVQSQIDSDAANSNGVPW